MLRLFTLLQEYTRRSGCGVEEINSRALLMMGSTQISVDKF